MVYEERPAQRVETQPPKPSDNSDWVPGYWDWDGDQWFWVNGMWIESREGQVYHSPEWARRGKGWIRLEGGYRDATSAQVE